MAQKLILRNSQWNTFSDLCHGAYIRWICNFATADLPKLQLLPKYRDRTPLIFNKFNLKVDGVAPIIHYQNLIYETLNSTGHQIEDYGEILSKTQYLVMAATSILYQYDGKGYEESWKQFSTDKKGWNFFSTAV